MQRIVRNITLPNEEIVEAQAPVILSASRATDIPAFYGKWLLERLRDGYLQWKNPFNGKISYISLEEARLIVFWTKNPEPLFFLLDEIAAFIPNYYFQFTLNDYEAEGFEPGLPSLDKRIETFIRLSEKIGKEKVIWRFDPLLLTTAIGVEELLSKVEKIGNYLKRYTEKLVFSFADISTYRKVFTRLNKMNIPYIEFTPASMNEFATGLQQLNNAWQLELATCAEKINLDQAGISHNKCIDEQLIRLLFPLDEKLMSSLIPGKDKGQRGLCGCIASKDIGAYDTCAHQCIYCYANMKGNRLLE